MDNGKANFKIGESSPNIVIETLRSEETPVATLSDKEESVSPKYICVPSSPSGSVPSSLSANAFEFVFEEESLKQQRLLPGDKETQTENGEIKDLASVEDLIELLIANEGQATVGR